MKLNQNHIKIKKPQQKHTFLMRNSVVSLHDSTPAAVVIPEPNAIGIECQLSIQNAKPLTSRRFRHDKQKSTDR